MALAITNTNANISDTTLTYSIGWTGGVSGLAVNLSILVNGNVIGTASSGGVSGSANVSFTANNLYANATGSSLSGAVTFRVTNGVDTSNRTGGTITINARLTNHSFSTTANPFDLDNPTNMIATWTRPHSAFRARVRVYVNNVLIMNYSQFTTSMSRALTSGELANAITAMGGVSPRSLRFNFITQFVANTVVDLESTGTSITRSNGVIKQFVEPSELVSFDNFTIGNNISYEINQLDVSTTHNIQLKFGSTVILSRTNVGQGELSITPSGAEITAMYNATANVEETTATLILTTLVDGESVGATDSKTATATVDASILPDFDTITHSEQTVVPDVNAIIGGYVQGLSNLLLTITSPVASTGATLSSYRITLETTTINAVSGSTGLVSYSGTDLSLWGRVTDSRGRSKEKTVTVTILPYSVPNIEELQFVRTDDLGVIDPLGEYVKFIMKGHIQSLIVDSTEKNTLSIVFKTREVGEVDFTTEQTIAPTTTLTFDDESDIFSGYEIVKAYDGRVELIDKFFTSVAQLSVSRGIMMSWGVQSVAINKLVTDESRTLDVNGDIYMNDEKVQTAKIFTDFLSNGNQLHWTNTALASGSSGFLALVGDTTKYGATRLTSHASNANSGFRYMTNIQAFFVRGNERTTFIFTVRDVANAVTRFGFMSSQTDATSDDGAYFEVVQTTLVAKCAGGATTTTSGTSYNLTENTYYRAVIEVNSDVTSIRFILYEDDSDTILWETTMTETMPTSRLGHGVLSYLPSPASATIISIFDYMDMYYPKARRII